MIALLVDHLWQSTLFAAGAGLLTLAVRGAAAGVRYGLWLAASIKFLIPFGPLALVGRALVVHEPPLALQPDVAQALQQVVEPYAANASAPPPAVIQAVASSPAFGLVPAALAVLWALGFATVSVLWAVRWMRVWALLRASTPIALAAPIRARSSSALVEPGLVGLWRPVLIVPEGLWTQFSTSEIEAIIAHEACHLRRRDNLTAAVHMVVEALFWFHPLVWSLGARLTDERERACDENVVRTGADPQVYAGAILKVCRLYLQSPIACAAGVSGADLKTRMRRIMVMGSTVPLNLAKKLLLASAAALSVAAPLTAGLLSSAPAVAANASAASIETSPDHIAQLRAEQAEPRQAIAYDPKAFDQFVGYYQLAPTAVFTISRDGSALFSRLTGQDPVEIFPESPTKFFAKVVQAQISFTASGHAPASELVLHQGGWEQHAKRISEASAKAMQAALEKRIEANQPWPGTEAWLRRYIASMEAGKPLYDTMRPPLQVAVRSQIPMMKQDLKRWGPLKAITFKNVTLNGFDVYELDFQNAKVTTIISPLTPDGKIGGLRFQEQS